MKRSLTAAAAVFLSLNMAFSAVAATKLGTPQEVRWKEGEEAMMQWKRVEEAGGRYSVEVYLEDQLYYSDTYQYSATFKPEYHENNSFLIRLTDDGSYKFRVMARGDNVETLDSEWSDFSETWDYIRPESPLGVATNLRWEETTACWNAPAENAEYVKGYNYGLYADGDRITGGNCTPQLSYDFSRYITDPDVEYTFSVRVISNTPSKFYHGETIFCETPYGADAENKLISDQLDAILESEEAILNAPDTLSSNLKKVQVAMQSDADVLDKIAELEAAYTEQKGIAVGTQISSDVDMNEDDIKVVGAGLNAAENSDAVTFNVSKPKKEVVVDHTAYRNAVQVDLSLKGAAGTLKVPVQITLPIPAGSNPDFFQILHYHADGTYDVIFPLTKNSDNTVTFTVTSFSTFVLAEEGADPAFIATPSNATEFKDLADTLPAADEIEDSELAALTMAKLRASILNKDVKASDLDAEMVEKLDAIVEELARFDEEFAVNVEMDDFVADVTGAHLLAYVAGKGKAETITLFHTSLATASNATKLKFELSGKLTMADGSEDTISTLKTPLLISIAAPEEYDEVHKTSDKLSGDGIEQGPVDYEDGLITFFTTKLGTVYVKGSSSESGGDSSDDKPSDAGDSSDDKPSSGGDNSDDKPSGGDDSSDDKPSSGDGSSDDKPSSGGSSSRRSGPRSGIVKESDLPKSPAGGSWKLADGMYSYYYSDGTRAENVWLEIGSVWYYFGKDGIMATGWLKDNGNYFYLDPATGAMATGWREIDGTWYYFNEAGNGFKGMMLADTVVDGYQLDESGAWVS